MRLHPPPEVQEGSGRFANNPDRQRGAKARRDNPPHEPMIRPEAQEVHPLGALAYTRHERHLQLSVFLLGDETPCKIQRKDPNKGSGATIGYKYPGCPEARD